YGIRDRNVTGVQTCALPIYKCAIIQMFDSIQKGLTYMGFISKLFGTRSEREIKKFSAQVEQVMALEDSYRQLSDEDLKAKTQVFKDRLAQGATLDDILPEAFEIGRASCRERV